MSRDNYSAELSAAGYYLGKWVCDAGNREKLAKIINDGLDRYAQERMGRVNFLGKSCFDPSSNGVDVPSDDVEVKEVVDVPSDTLSIVSQGLERAAAGTVFAVQTAVNYGRLFSAQAMDKALSNRAELVLKMFRRIDKDNAQIAFLFIGRQPDGWGVAGGVARVSLNTLIICSVLEHVVEAYRNEKKPSIEEGDAGKEEDPNEKERRGHFTLFCTFWGNAIHPLVIPDQAKTVFVGFEGYPRVLSLSRALTEAEWEQVSMPTSEASRPSA